MGTFVINPRGPGLSSVTCSMGEDPTVDYQIGPGSIDMNEPARLQVVYQQGEFGGFVRKVRRGLVPIKFTAVVFGSSQAACYANYQTFLEAITNADGGTVQYKPLGLGAGVLDSYYHYLQSRPPVVTKRGALHDIAMGTYQQMGRPGSDYAIECSVELQTQAWVTSDPETYQTLKTATAINNEGTSLIVDSGDIKGLAAQGVVEVEGTMTSSDDTLRDMIIYKKKMRTTDNSELEWIEAEDMDDPTGGYDYSRFIGIRWRIDQAHSSYPVDVFNNSLDGAQLITDTKAQSDGDDVRVFIDGIEQDRWLQDFNSSTSQCWVNLDFVAKIDLTLDGAIDSDDLSFVVNEDITDMPTSGVVLIESEYIKYSAKDSVTKTFTVQQRGYGDTTAASHADTTATYWIQHDLWVKYGDGTLSAPTVNDNYKPAFDLDSTNTSWEYSYFGNDIQTRTGAWTYVTSAYMQHYTANRGSNADPWEEMGLYASGYVGIVMTGIWVLTNYCQMTNITFSNGEKYASQTSDWFHVCRVRTYTSTWNTEYDVPVPSSDDTWESWSYGPAASTSGAYILQLYIEQDASDDENYVEVSDVDVTLDSSRTPSITVCNEIPTDWAEVSDSSASGNAYMQVSAASAYLAITSSNTAGMDRTYVGKVTPIVIARCEPDTTYDVWFAVYVSNRVAVWQQTEKITLEGTTYWQCLYRFGEIDLPPFIIPEHVAEADIDDYIDTLFIELTIERAAGTGHFDVDAVCLAKADEWISHLYNDVDSTGLQQTSGDVLLVDSSELISHTFDSSNDVLQRWKNEGVPLNGLTLDGRYDHRIRALGFRDQDTLKYTPTYTFSMTVKGIYLTIYPFSE